jgi:hypothetical protein
MVNSVQIRSEIAAFLESKRANASCATARLVFALDATASREPTWDIACDLQSQMFGEVAAIGNLSIQLVYYRGIECRASGWMGNAHQLARLMRGIRCEAGKTQIDKVLRHVAREHERAPVAALVFVGDAFEESRDEVVTDAHELGLPAFLFQEGSLPAVEGAFREIARATGGAYGRFDNGAAKQLGELLRAVAAFAVGGRKALASRKDEASARLLEQLKSAAGQGGSR